MRVFKSGGRNIMTIRSEALLEVIKRHFRQISLTQWSMLARGAWDEATKETLLNMFIELVQSLSTSVLRFLVPINEVISKCPDKIQASKALDSFSLIDPEGLYCSAVCSGFECPRRYDGE